MRLAVTVLLACVFCLPSRAQHVIGCIGDSITYGYLSSPAVDPCAMLAQDVSAATGQTWTSDNYGKIGSASGDWISGSTYLTQAISSFTSTGVNYVTVMLGSNDARTDHQTSQATYQSNMANMIAALKSAGLNKIMLNYMPYINTNVNGWTVATSDPYLLLYQSALQSLVATDPTHVFLGDTTAYTFFENNTGLLNDGVHPTNAGYVDLSQLWANAFESNFSSYIASPTSGATWTDWTGNSFQVGAVPAGTAMVCYDVDANHATNPASGDLGNASQEGALYEDGCSNIAPFSFAFNTFWVWNGNHTVTAHFYNAVGTEIGTPATQNFVIANGWPVTCTPVLSVNPSTPVTSNWSGLVTLTATMTGCSGDTYEWDVWVDGIQQIQEPTTTTSPGTLHVDTTRSLNGSHVVALAAFDRNKSNTQQYSQGFQTELTQAGQWTATVNFSNSSSVGVEVHGNAPGATGAHEIYLTPTGAGSTFTLSPILLNADGSTASSPTFDFVSLNPAVATVSTATGSSTTVTATAPSMGSTRIQIMAEVSTITDAMEANSNTNAFSSATYTLRGSDVGMLARVTGGTGCNVGKIFQVSSYFNNGSSEWYTLTDPATNLGINTVFTSGSGPCTIALGPSRFVWAKIAPTNTLPNFDSNGNVQQSYVSNSTLMSEVFSSSGELQSQIYPTPYLTSYCNSGYNTLETGINSANAAFDGSQTESAFLTQQTNYLTGLAYWIQGCPRIKYFGTGDGLDRTTAEMFTSIQGPTANTNTGGWNPGGLTGVGLIYQSLVNSGIFTAVSLMDEINNWGQNPIQGALMLGSAAGVQNWLSSITASGGICSVSASSASPGGGWTLWGNAMAIYGSSPSGGLANLNSPAGTIYNLSGNVGVVNISGTTLTWVSGSNFANVNAGDSLAIAEGTSSQGTFTVSSVTSSTQLTLTSAPTNYTGATYADTRFGVSEIRGAENTSGATVTWVSGPQFTSNYFQAGDVVNITQGSYSGNFTISSVNSATQLTLTTAPPTSFSAGGGMLFTNLTRFDFLCPAAYGNDGTYTSSNDPGLSINPYGVAGWFNSNTTLMLWDTWAQMIYDIEQGAPNLPIAGSQAAGTGPAAMAAWEANSPQSITVNGKAIANISKWADFYWSHSSQENYLGDQGSNLNALASDNTAASIEEGYFIRSFYGAYNPALPISTITQGTPHIYALDSTQNTSIASCQGDVITFSKPHRIQVAFGQLTRMYGSNICGTSGGTVDYEIEQVLSPTAVVVSLYQSASESGTGGTITFQNGDTLALSSISTSTHDQTFTYTGSATDTVNHHRGQTFTISGNSNSYFNTTPFIYGMENLLHATSGNGGPSTSNNYFRELVNYSCSASCGSVNLIRDNLYVKGRTVGGGSDGSSGGTPDGTKEWAFLSYIEAMINRAWGTRLYKQMDNPQAYNQQAYLTMYDGLEEIINGGYTGSIAGSYTFDFEQAPTQGMQLQHFVHPTVESGMGTPVWHAGSMASMIWRRWLSLIDWPSLNSPDYGERMDCMARAGSKGDILVCGNFSNAPLTRTFTLSPYLQSGQTIIRQIANATKILTATLAAGTASDTVTLQGGDSVWYMFPATFAGTLSEPTMSVNLADVPGATGWAVRYGYDQYTLDANPDNVFDCGAAATCTVPIDLKIGQPGARYYRIVYYGSQHQVLSQGDVQTL